MNQQYYAKKQQYYARTAESISALGKRLLHTNLCKEIILMAPQMATLSTMKFEPVYKPKYKFSRNSWYVADFDTQYYFEVEEWCKEQFGPHPRYPDAWSRWVHTYEDKIHFRDKEDYIMFKLRWGE